jgi:DinB superfamily
MKNLCLSALLFALALCLTATRAHAAKPEDKTAPSYDMKAQSLQDLDDMHKKFVRLAEATPAEKFSWRPSPDTRSVSEAFLHVCNMNYGMPAAIGADPAPGYDGKTLEKSTVDKAKVIAQLNQCFDYVHKFVDGMTNGDFAKPEPKLGPEANAGDVVYIIIADDHEHLGQSVAYARINGITPPWTLDAAAAKAKAAAEQKKN